MLPGELARTITNGQAFDKLFIASRQPFDQPAVEINSKSNRVGGGEVARIPGNRLLPVGTRIRGLVVEAVNLEVAKLLGPRRQHIMGTLPRNKPASLHAKHGEMGYLPGEQPWVLASIDQPDDRDHRMGCCFGNGFRPGVVAEMSEGGMGVGFDSRE